MEDKTTAAESRHETIKQTVNQLQERASSVLSFTSRWKDMEDHLDYTNNVIQERTEELLSIQASVKHRLVLAEDKEREVNERETEFLEKQRKDVEVIEKSLKEIEAVRVLVEEKLREIGDREERFERLSKSIDEKVSDVRAFEREVNERIKEIGRKEGVFEERMIRLEAKEKVVKKLFKGFELRERAMSTREVEVEGKEKKLEEGFMEIGLKEEKIEARCRRLELGEKKLEQGFKEIVLEEEKVEGRCRRVELEEKKLEEGFKEITLKEEKVEERSKEVELKERKIVESLNTPRVKTIEPQDHNSTCVETTDNVVDHSAEASICFSVKMDGKALQVFLNERWRDHDLMRNEVEVALRLSSGPAKLILDAMQGFYPPHLKKGDVEFEEGVVRRSCNLLLEQLMVISPPITPHVRKEAMKIAFNWMTKLRKDDGHSLEILVFLQLVACYGLGSSFDNDELLSYLKIIAQHTMTPTLFCVLGFADKVSGNENKSFSPDVIAHDLVLNSTSTTCPILTSPPISTSTAAPTPKTPSRKQRGTKRPWTAVSAEEDPNAFLDISVNLACQHACSTKDGKALQMFLNKHCKQHDKMRNVVLDALRLSSDPAELVLDAMKGFYPPHLKNDDRKCDVRRSCILLLEQLMKISPPIKPHVKEVAMKLAFEWKTKMRAKNYNEVLGFLRLLASYGLSSAFDADELLNHLETVAQYCQSPELFRALNLSVKISGYVHHLIKNKQVFVAIRFIYAFELVNKFPPVPLLKEFIKDSETAAIKKKRENNRSVKAQIKATDIRVADLMVVLRCIKDYKIESELSPMELEKQISFLKKSISNMRRKLHLNKKKHLPPKVAAATAPITVSSFSPTIASCSSTSTIPKNQPHHQEQHEYEHPQSQHESQNKRPRKLVSSGGLPPQASCYGNTNFAPTFQPPHHQQDCFFMNDGLHFNSSARYDRFTHDYQPINPQKSSYYSDVNPYYQPNAFGWRGYGDASPFQRL